jgi:protocatechuate 3,4-dioxygenase alpha subunit
MTPRRLTPSQTIGPFFHGMIAGAANVLVAEATEGERIRIEGRVYDGDHAPVPDALVEIWQANARGRYRHPVDRRPIPLDPAFVGFGRAATDETGLYWFETIKPGPVPFTAERRQAPHLNVAVSARGLLDHLFTRIYLESEPANAEDPVLQRVPAPRRDTLIARRAAGAGRAVYRFDIVLQGEQETVFFDL